MAVILIFGIIFCVKIETKGEALQNCVTVNLVDVVNGKSSAVITVNGTYIIEEKNVKLKSGASYTVSLSGSGVNINGGGISYTCSSLNLIKQDSSLLGITLRNKAIPRTSNYLGNFRFTNSSGTFKIYNYVDLETYLYGVVGQEMSDGDKLEALKAQAIAARTFAYNQNFSVEDGTRSQAYAGYRSTDNNVIQAVDSTRGVVLTYKGDMVKSFYSARNGGYTDTPYYAWGSTDDKYEYYALKADDADGRINSAAYTSTYKFPKDTSSCSIDSGLNSFLISQIESQKGYSSGTQIKINKFTGVSPNTPRSRYPSNAPTLYSMATINAVISVNGQTQNISINISLKSLEQSCKDTYLHRVYTVTSDSNYIILRGAGTPHGIGLSQMGAQQRAIEGENCQQILAFYYSGTDLTTVDTHGDNPNYWYGAVIGQVNLRKGPSTSYDIIKELNVGTKLIIEQNSITSWVKVRLLTGEEGYLSSNYIIVGDKPQDNIPATGVTVSPSSTVAAKGMVTKLTATLSPSNTTDTVRSWSSSNTNVAAVDASGNVTAKDVGASTITATTTNGLTASCTFTVTDKTALKTAIGSVPSDGSVFTDATWTSVTAELSNANKVNDNLNATQTEIDSACVYLKAAISGLIKKSIAVQTGSGLKIEDNCLICSTDFSGTSVSALLGKLYVNGGSGILKIFGMDNLQKSDTAIAGTGMTVKLYGNDMQNPIDMLTIVLKGDLDGDGYINSTDKQYISEYSRNERTLTGAYYNASDINDDGVSDIADVLLLEFKIGGTKIPY